MKLEDLYTIVYYTGNTESSDFEDKIIENLIKQSGNIPIISVTQKPLNLGKNICVGNVGHSYFNAFRQILIGVKEVKTPYVIRAESDFIHSPSYFSFKNPVKDVYMFDNVWMVFHKSARRFEKAFYKKGASDGCQIFKKEKYIELAEKEFEGKPMWSTEHGARNVFERKRVELFTGVPCISFKTEDGMSFFTKTKLHPSGTFRFKSEVLPYWGTATEIENKYFNE